MTGWTAIVPFNHGGMCKTRLAPLLTVVERDALALAMARHVAAMLTAAPYIETILLLAPESPALPGTGWIADQGRGLNAELVEAYTGLSGRPVLLIHADLPLLTADDVEALLAAASVSGAAIAPDAAGAGTNAIALADGRPFTPAFGLDSLARHRAQLPDARLTERVGLTHDVDDPDSLRLALSLGFAPPLRIQDSAA